MEYIYFWINIIVLNTLIKVKNMTLPNSWKKLCKFIGLVNYYHNVSAIFSDKLEPLTKCTYIKVKFKYTELKKSVSKQLRRLWP